MRAPGRTRFHKVLHSILLVQTSRPLLTVLGALVLAGFAVFFTVTRLGFQTSQSALISSDNRLMQSLKIADRFSDLEAFVVAIENWNTDRSLAFVRDLAPRLEADHEHFAQVFSRVDPAHFRPWTLLYLTPKEAPPPCT